MSQPPASGSMSRTPAAAPPPSSNIEGIFESALKSYKKMTKHDLKKHDLFKQFETCDSPGAILTAFQSDQFGLSRIGDASKKWFVPTVNVLYAFSATLGEGVGLAFSPAKVIFAGVGVLLLAAKDVAASQDILIDILGRIGGFFGRLEIYTGVPLIPAMKNKMVEITVEVLDILAIATKEMRQSRARKFVKRVAGRTDLEDGMKKLDTLTREEVAMASAEHLRVANVINNKATVIANGIQGVEQNVQVIADDGKKVMATTMEVKLIAQQAADNVDDMMLKQLRESVRKWQSPPDPSTSHNFASDRQHEGTAEWLLEDDKFGKWKVTGSLLWIHGKPGSGKSVLCSAIINDITTLCKDGSASIAYFYFDFRETDKQSRRNLLSSLLAQLSHRSDHFCDVLSVLYKAHDNGARQPSDSALMQCLTEMLTLPDQGPVYLIMDALDECPITSGFPSARKRVLDLVKDLVHLRLPNLHIVVTSRPEVDIVDVLRPLAPHEISLHDERGQQKDIADFVKSVVNSDSGAVMKKWRKADKDLVVETLSKEADGMFRWVFCQLEMLQNCIPQNIRRVLSELPKSLDETYERMLKEIGKVNPHQAHRLLQCLAVATRPLRVDELAEVLALDFDGAGDGIPALNKDWRWGDQQQGVLSTCSSLVVVVDGHDDDFRRCRVVQFAHFSVKEFLTSDRLADLKADFSHFHIRPEPAHTVITQACLATLLQSDCNDREQSSSPLSRYATRHWVGHARFENVSLRVEDGMRRLFDPAKPYFAAWLNSYDVDNRWESFQQRGSGANSGHFTLSSKPTLSAPLCLYYASLCGFPDLSKYLIAEYPQHVNARVGFNESPLVGALLNRHWQVAELLHRNHAVVNVTGYNNCTPLHAASKDGIVDVAQWLLDHGADANLQDNDRTTPLHLAATNGHPELVRMLLGYNVDVNARNRDHSTPFHMAFSFGNTQIMQLLIKHGADVNALDRNHSTPLHLVSFTGSAESVRLLIELGADVNLRDGNHKTALHLALSPESSPWRSLSDQRVMQLLIHDEGSDTPYLASSKGNAETVQLLIEHGADVNALDPDHSTPLHLASSLWDTQVMQLLIEHGADVNALDRNHSTPLHLVSFMGSAESVRLLIELGADVNLRDGNHKTALHLALSPYDSRWMLLSDQRVMQLLIQNGADVDAQDGGHLTPLHLASYRGDAKTVKLLLQHQADFRAQDQNHSMPLHLASSRGNTEIVQLLIEHGADIDALDWSYSKPVRTMPVNDQCPRTNTVALFSEQLKSLDPPGPVQSLSHYLTYSNQFRNVSGSSSGTTTEFETSIGDIVKTVERFRILVVGRSGVGKSSLISCVFGIDNASVVRHKPGEWDIQQELVSPENQYFVLHDSRGFEPGDLSNYETVRTFIEQGSQQHLPLKDRIHCLWLCVETPTAGGRVFERGEEYLLKFAHDIQIPIVLVFTRYDRLVRTKKAELQEEHENLDEIFLRNQSEKNATNVFNKCLQSLQRIFGRLDIPMPHCAGVSIRKGYQESISALVESTRDVVRDRLGGDAWIMWSIAQRASPSVKMEACVTKGMSPYNHFLPGGMPGSERLLLRDCLEKVHRDIVTCWNFKGEVLDSKEFAYLMLRLSQDIQTEPGASRSNIDMISQFVALVTSASLPTQPLESILGFTSNFVQSFSTAVLENTSWLQRFLMTYTVDLVSVLGKLFDTTLTATWDGVREAYGAYEQSGSRQRLHNRILSNTAPGGLTLKMGGIDGMVHV